MKTKAILFAAIILLASSCSKSDTPIPASLQDRTALVKAMYTGGEKYVFTYNPDRTLASCEIINETGIFYKELYKKEGNTLMVETIRIGGPGFPTLQDQVPYKLNSDGYISEMDLHNYFYLNGYRIKTTDNFPSSYKDSHVDYTWKNGNLISLEDFYFEDSSSKCVFEYSTDTTISNIDIAAFAYQTNEFAFGIISGYEGLPSKNLVTKTSDPDYGERNVSYVLDNEKRLIAVTIGDDQYSFSY